MLLPQDKTRSSRVKGLYGGQPAGATARATLLGKLPGKEPNAFPSAHEARQAPLSHHLSVSEAQFFPDYILAPLSSTAVRDLGVVALEYMEGSQESELINV